MFRILSLTTWAALSACVTDVPESSGDAFVDKTAPAWTDTPTLDVTRVEMRSAIATWSEAFDDSGEVHYMVLVDGREAGTSETPYRRLSGLVPGQLHRITVMAVDPSGNVAAETLQGELRTPYGCEARGVALPRRIH